VLPVLSPTFRESVLSFFPDVFFHSYLLVS